MNLSEVKLFTVRFALFKAQNKLLFHIVYYVCDIRITNPYYIDIIKSYSSGVARILAGGGKLKRKYSVFEKNLYDHPPLSQRHCMTPFDYWDLGAEDDNLAKKDD